ncbi:hypothetical protein ACRE_073010 [Hapsidospora chrysogenum ATCC 11550]|uniref:Uncharacterized protein n=1 Tax=Hapsidospora chrysogenum (strain ATCC 11550 / CBS 779.69 / DSM 880 / IAM 14645 / JCM 23072 / IMI 49137) TaxID=857340 RepID=A0A086SY08_HAPC1|nr:hypothetical protein ACRE_073010 [Hapsidospora chrysogenum ATCC 11550]
MPSVSNPNGPSRNRLAARASKAKKIQRQKSKAGQHKISKKEASLGARPGLAANSGPTRVLSKKKARKLEKKMGHALRRKMEAEGVVEMKDAPEVEESKEGTTKEVEMDIQ